MKLLLVGPYPVRNNGISDYMAHYREELERQGHRVETETIYFWRDKARNGRWLTLAARLREGFDAVIVEHTPTATGPLLPLFLRAAARRKVPVAVVGHETPSVYARHLPAFLRPLYHAYERAVYHGAACRVVHTAAHARELRAIGVEGDIQVIPIPVYGPVPPSDAGARRAEWGYYGMISPKKGLDLLLEAYQSRPAGHFPLLRILGGAAPGNEAYVETLKASVRPGYSDHIVFNGYVEEDALARIFAGISLMILPYRWISQSAVLAQACMNRIPFLASDLPYFADFAREYGCGRLFRAGSAEALASALEAARENPPAAGGPEFDKVIGELSLARCAGRLMECIEHARHAA
jgi:glycosyltransferase involved in cell wall biosynthesis